MVAPGFVIDAIAVADVAFVDGAERPNRVLDEPGKIRRKAFVAFAGIGPLRQTFDQVGTAVVGITGGTNLMLGGKPP